MEISRRFLLVCATLIWCFLDTVHSARFRSGSSRCKSSEKCIDVLQCPALQDMFDQRGKNPFILTILKEKRCGSKPTSLEVCCPLRTSSPDFSECGKSKKVEQFNRIAGGTDASLGSWPWMVAVYRRKENQIEPEFELQCGASLISRQWVITAAHCVPDHVKKVLLRLGDLDVDNRVKDGASPITVTVDKIVEHPEYKPDSSSNDMALLRLKNPVNFTENIRPICLLSGQEYKKNSYYDQKLAYVTGWGAVVEGVRGPSRLQQITVNGTPIEKCKKQYGKSPTDRVVIDDTVICARGPGRDSCLGDSGGPFMFLNNTEARFYLAGVTSGGLGCAEENYPGVYTRVAQFISWIDKVTGERFKKKARN